MLRIRRRAAIAAAQNLAIVGDTIEKNLRTLGDGLGQSILDLQLEFRAVLEMFDDTFADIHLICWLF